MLTLRTFKYPEGPTVEMVHYVRFKRQCFIWEGKYQKCPGQGMALKICYTMPSPPVTPLSPHMGSVRVTGGWWHVDLQVNSCDIMDIHTTSDIGSANLNKQMKNNCGKPFLIVEISWHKKQGSYRYLKEIWKSKPMTLTSFQRSRYISSFGFQVAHDL